MRRVQFDVVPRRRLARTVLAGQLGRVIASQIRTVSAWSAAASTANATAAAVVMMVMVGAHFELGVVVHGKMLGKHHCCCCTS